MSKYLFDEIEVSKELVILLAIFNSSNANHKLLDPLATDNLLPIYYTEWNIIQEKLISTAIKLRMIDDQFKKLSKEPVFLNNKTGVLKTKNKTIDLTLREACNKIIHAVKFSPKNYTRNGLESRKHFLPKVNLEGDYHKKGWKATLDIKKYVSEGLCLVKQYDEDWEISTR